MKNSSSTKALSLYSLVAISIVAIFTPRTLPLMAEYGLASVVYYLLAALLFFIPSSLMFAELATGWPKTGGLYIWSRTAFGNKIGFLTLWLEWINNVVSWPASLTFISATLAYAIAPSLAQSKLYTIIIIMILFWGFTFINALGIKISARLSAIGLIFGTVLPVLLIISFGAIWLFEGHPVQTPIDWHHAIPGFHFESMALLIGVMLGFAGMQITAFHANDVENPQRNFPRAILLATIIILLFAILGSLAIAIVVPTKTMSLVAGNIQTIQIFFSSVHLHYLVPVVAILIAVGTAAGVNAWIGGPSKAMFVCAEYGDLPKFFTWQNRFGAPIGVLLAQGVVVTALILIFLYLPHITSAYWIITVLSAMMSMMMNMLLFAATIRLRYTHPDVKRSYKIPGGKLGVWFVCGIGLLACGFSIVLGFIAPSQLGLMTETKHCVILVVALLVLMLPAVFIHRRINR